jgi:hypothetical protein
MMVSFDWCVPSTELLRFVRETSLSLTKRSAIVASQTPHIEPVDMHINNSMMTAYRRRFNSRQTLAMGSSEMPRPIRALVDYLERSALVAGSYVAVGDGDGQLGWAGVYHDDVCAADLQGPRRARPLAGS